MSATGRAEQASPSGLSKAAEANRRLYERWMFVDSVLSPDGDYLEGSGFANYGYWEPNTRSAREACELMMEHLVARLPERRGRVLDVACGLGATSAYLGRHFGPENVTGVNISQMQLDACRKRAPGSTFVLMDATRLELEPSSFDHVVCVEAAFHFDTRRRFLQQVLRVLKPGGYLMLTDMLHDRWGEKLNPLLHVQNHVADPEEYSRVLRETGFTEVRTDDVTEECWIRSNRHVVSYVTDQLHRGALDRESFNRLMTARLLRLVTTRYYLMAWARKPPLAVATETADPGSRA